MKKTNANCSCGLLGVELGRIRAVYTFDTSCMFHFHSSSLGKAGKVCKDACFLKTTHHCGLLFQGVDMLVETHVEEPNMQADLNHSPQHPNPPPPFRVPLKHLFKGRCPVVAAFLANPLLSAYCGQDQTGFKALARSENGAAAKALSIRASMAFNLGGSVCGGGRGQ